LRAYSLAIFVNAILSPSLRDANAYSTSNSDNRSIGKAPPAKPRFLLREPLKAAERAADAPGSDGEFKEQLQKPHLCFGQYLDPTTASAPRSLNLSPAFSVHPS
jgi:hypothetical protein